MKLRTRLIVSFCIIIFVPLCMTALLVFGFWKVQEREFLQSYQFSANPYEYITNSVRILSRFTATDYEELLLLAQENPQDLEDEEFLAEYNEQLQEKYSYLVVRKESTLIFVGEEDAPEELPTYGEATSGLRTAYIDAECQCLVKQIDFIFADGSQGSVFLITSIVAVIPELRALLIRFALAVVMILIFTAALLVSWIYKSVFDPISRLQVAAESIKEGDLEFTLEPERPDEIGDLYQSFEEMRRRLYDSAEAKIENEKESKELISNISHDLKTPITAIKGYVEGIIDGVADTPEKMDRYIRTIYNKACEMDTLINELTLYAKIDTNRVPYHFNCINVTEYFNDCVEELALDLEERQIYLAYFNYIDPTTRIIADPEQLKRVINNIIGNSIKYLDKEKGYLTIRVKDVGDFVQVEIEDNGRGIDAKDLPFIFDRFYRTDASRNSQTGGSGIGLSIVKKIIVDHGGSIWATSKEGSVTTMYFVIRKYQEVRHEEGIDY